VGTDSDAGIDKQDVLSAITGAAPAPQPVQERPPSATRRAIPPPAGLARWLRHRSELAAIVTGFVALLWISAGLALGSWMPVLIGAAFGVAALGIWSLEVWNGD
jgi:hypothetical protein